LLTRRQRQMCIRDRGDTVRVVNAPAAAPVATPAAAPAAAK
jgi:hypothetical protein